MFHTLCGLFLVFSIEHIQISCSAILQRKFFTCFGGIDSIRLYCSNSRHIFAFWTTLVKSTQSKKWWELKCIYGICLSPGNFDICFCVSPKICLAQTSFAFLDLVGHAESLRFAQRLLLPFLTCQNWCAPKTLNFFSAREQSYTYGWDGWESTLIFGVRCKRFTKPLQFHVLLRDRTIFAGLETNQRGAAVLFVEVPVVNFSPKYAGFCATKMESHVATTQSSISVLRTGHVVYSWPLVLLSWEMVLHSRQSVSWWNWQILCSVQDSHRRSDLLQDLKVEVELKKLIVNIDRVFVAKPWGFAVDVACALALVLWSWYLAYQNHQCQWREFAETRLLIKKIR